MLIIKVEKGNIEKALKNYKHKSIKIKQIKKLREKDKYTKPSVAKRAQIQKAKYVEKKHGSN
jgi:small subunit ribosomal protein S21